ncbi:glutamate racemase [Legionella sp. 16cNR16C]|uniref:glutamate racemase n=1 Tax=Legionella sp. 16cNR16C TaxID=2905656 RepID=UPI001E4DB5DD|nr:glutamate racemase [Legionella sp. 16cNR16C]MCE3045956.1 glutamate racemase [Legionella sp. 16cNR16C]
MNNNNLPVGVFDSGMGGLTVLRALKSLLPRESFIYLGDTARLPYGTKSAETVQQYAVQMARLLIARRIKALVIACNTATTAALPYLQAMFTEIPVIGVVRPGAGAVVAATRNQQITVFATETTIASNAYQRLITEQLPQATISARACSVLVALAEEGMVNNAVAREALLYYLSEFKNEDTLLLGCTHFPVFRPLLATLLPESVAVVDSAEATAYAFQKLLYSHHLQTDSASPGNIEYLVTDSIRRFQTVGEIFLGEVLKEHHIELVDACLPVEADNSTRAA